jgi:hypothetical protein
LSNPIDNPELWDSVVVGGRPQPAEIGATPRGHEREWDWDTKPAKGQDGASSSLNGATIGGFFVDYEFLSEDMQLWLGYQRHLETMVTGPEPKAYPIYHPDLEANRYTEASIKKIGDIIHDGKGGCKVIVQFIEYKPPKPKVVKSAKPKTSGTGSSKSADGTVSPPAPDPNAAAKAELAALMTEAQTP